MMAMAMLTPLLALPLMHLLHRLELWTAKGPGELPETGEQIHSR